VLLSILENPDAYGVRLMKPKDSSTVAKEREELEALAQRLAQYEGTRQLADALYHLAADNVTRIVLKANGPLVPGAPREFLGVKNHEYKFGGGYAVGYAVPITRFAEIFLLSVYDEQPPDPQNSVSTVSNLDEVPASTSRNNE
jgi:hypothetical protein